MFRLIVALFLLVAVSSASAAEAGFAALMEQLDGIPNPFAQPVANNDRAGMDSLYGSLNAIDGVIYGEGGAGCVVIAGKPWRTGENQVIVGSSGRTNVELVSVNRSTDSRPGVAKFRSSDGEQEISIDLPSIEPAIDYSAEPAGWLIAGARCVTMDKVAMSGLRVKAKGSEFKGEVVAQSSSSGLMLIALDAPAGPPIKWAPLDYVGLTLVVPPHGETLQVPSQVLSDPPPRDDLLGAMVSTPEGELVGVLGRQGLVRPEALGLSPEKDGVKFPSPYSRRVTFRDIRPKE
jgi:hypothetical protein